MSEWVSYVWFPIEVVVDGDPQVYGLICCCKGMASRVVLVFNWVIGSGQDGVSYPTLFSYSQLCEVIFENIPVILRCNFPV